MRNVRKRKAISPVLATVILIAITLVAGVAIAGFAFGLFGTLGTTANISVIAASCVGNATPKLGTASITVTNSGGSAGSITGSTPSTTFKVTGAPISVPANTASKIIPLTGNMTSGQTVTGNLVVNGGSPVPFSVTCT